LDCGDLHNGFARVRCEDCGHEYFLAFSCKRRHFCPSCHQKRVVEFGYDVQTLLRFPQRNTGNVVTRLDQKRLPKSLQYQDRLFSAGID